MIEKSMSTICLYYATTIDLSLEILTGMTEDATSTLTHRLTFSTCSPRARTTAKPTHMMATSAISNVTKQRIMEKIGEIANLLSISTSDDNIRKRHNVRLF